MCKRVFFLASLSDCDFEAFWTLLCEKASSRPSQIWNYIYRLCRDMIGALRCLEKTIARNLGIYFTLKSTVLVDQWTVGEIRGLLWLPANPPCLQHITFGVEWGLLRQRLVILSNLPARGSVACCHPKVYSFKIFSFYPSIILAVRRRIPLSLPARRRAML